MSSRPVVLVTGAARRLGRDIALELAANGWDVAVHYRSSGAEADSTTQDLRALGAQAQPFQAALDDEGECRSLVPAVVGHFERLHAVVNSAALFEYDNVHSFGYALMERHWRSNVGPAIVLGQALHAQLQAQAERGCIVNLLDQKLWNPNPDHLSYSLSKAALEAANTLLAQALAPVVRVCGVAPGVTLPSGPMSASQFAQAHALTPLGRASTPADVARAVRFLLESAAITGTTLLVDGGQHLMAQPRDPLYLVEP